MFSNEIVQMLLALPKHIEENNKTTINISAEKTRLLLKNEDEPEYSFLFEISSNRKITFKISFHNQENNTKQGLIRVDYKSGHKNPEVLNEHVPEKVKPYQGYFFQNEPHVHIYVEGYKDLAWAIPVTDYGFPVLDINNTDDFIEAIKAFAKEINIVTDFNIQNAII